ncbi:MAG: hypothetical protein ABL936_06050 [Aestuariivirga sp.]
MTEKSQLVGLLAAQEVVATGLTADPEDPLSFTVFVEVIRDKNNQQAPSNKKLKIIANEFEAIGGKVSFVLLDGHNRDMEAGLRASILQDFIDVVRNAFVSIEGLKPVVWLEVKGNLTAEVSKALQSKVQVYMKLFGFDDFQIAIVRDGNAPSKLAILKQVRLYSPVDLDSLKQKLLNRKFDVPSDSWLAHKLDALRKDKMVVRLKDGKYALTLLALKASGSSKNRKSPDVERLLELSRRER